MPSRATSATRVGEAGEVDGDAVEVEARVDARHRQQVLGQASRPPGLADDGDAELLALPPVVHAAQETFGGGLDPGERRTQLVRRVGQERRSRSSAPRA